MRGDLPRVPRFLTGDEVNLYKLCRHSGAWDWCRTSILRFFRPPLRPLKLPKHKRGFSRFSTFTRLVLTHAPIATWSDDLKHLCSRSYLPNSCSDLLTSWGLYFASLLQASRVLRPMASPSGVSDGTRTRSSHRARATTWCVYQFRHAYHNSSLSYCSQRLASQSFSLTLDFLVIPRNAASDDGRSNDVLLTKGSFTFFVATSTTAGGEERIRTSEGEHPLNALAGRRIRPTLPPLHMKKDEKKISFLSSSQYDTTILYRGSLRHTGIYN